MGDPGSWEFGAIKLAFYLKVGNGPIATYGPAKASPSKDRVYPGPSGVGPNYNDQIPFTQDNGADSLSRFIYARELLNDQCKCWKPGRG